MMTADECIKAAFQALLRGDTAARDRYCRMAESLMAGTMENPAQPARPIHIGQANPVPRLQ